MFRKKIHLLGREGHTGWDSRAPMAQSHLCWLQNIDYGSKHFLRERRDEFRCCCTPCPCCHVSMEMKEGQDVAHLYLGGWQDRQLVNTSPSTPTQYRLLSPVDPQAHCLLRPSPFWSCIMPTGLQAGLAGNSKNLSMLVKLSSSPGRAVKLSRLGEKPSAPATLCNCCCSSICLRQNKNINLND